MTQVERIALFAPSLAGGGAERFILTLARALSDTGLVVDVVVTRASGPLVQEVPESVRLVDLGATRMSACLVPLLRYLRRERPRTMLAVSAPTNCLAVWARLLSGVRFRLILSERNAPFRASAAFPDWRGLLMPILMRVSYPLADAILAVSHGVADDLARTIRLPRENIEVVYNPVITEIKLERSREALEHPWFEPGEPPVILGAGRLIRQKDFALLIRAFARLRSERRIRLMILGEGAERGSLTALVEALGLQQDVALPGFVANPWAYMRRSALFVLSSRWEGLPAVLIEAMALGTPVVSTDCPSGPFEILEGGRWGPLVIPGDEQALTNAMRAQLDAPVLDATARGRQFAEQPAVSRYREILCASLH